MGRRDVVARSTGTALTRAAKRVKTVRKNILREAEKKMCLGFIRE
jgi:hypothetical protein